MTEHLQFSVHEGVAIVTIDNPPVNALSAGVPDGIASAVARAGFNKDPMYLAIRS